MVLFLGGFFWGGTKKSSKTLMPAKFVPVSSFAKNVQRIKNPDDVLVALHDAIPTALSLSSEQADIDIRVAAVWFLPNSRTDHGAIVPGKTLFLHDSLAATALFRDYMGSVAARGATAIAEFGRRRSAPFTLTEAMKEMRLAGEENWIIDMLRGHGIRDALYCPFRRWALTFWSPKVLDRLSTDTRAMLFAIAGVAVARIDRLAKMPEELETVGKLTDRELSILRLISEGQSTAEAAAFLNIGLNTVTKHVKNAMQKLNAHHRAHAIATAIRQGLMT
jgi:DNA-binding CsgD family transcriptional regulator